MRKDMDKVVIDCARRGSRDTYRDKARNNRRHIGRHKTWLNRRRENDWDLLPSKEPMGSWRSGTKGQCDRLNPLINYLDSKVGEKWDDVWSEIRKTIPADGTMQIHVHEHLRDMVEVNTVMVDGKVHYFSLLGWKRGSGPVPITDMRGRWWDRLYVHPETGVLCKAPRKHNNWKKKARRKRIRSVKKGLRTSRSGNVTKYVAGLEFDRGNWRSHDAPYEWTLDDNTRIYKVNGGWFIRKSWISHYEKVPEHRWYRVKDEETGFTQSEKRLVGHKYEPRWAREDRQLSKREIKEIVPDFLR